MKVHSRQRTVVSTLGAMLISAWVFGAQSAQHGPASAPIGNAKPLLLEKKRRRTARAARRIGCSLTKRRQTC